MVVAQQGQAAPQLRVDRRHQVGALGGVATGQQGAQLGQPVQLQAFLVGEEVLNHAPGLGHGRQASSGLVEVLIRAPAQARLEALAGGLGLALGHDLDQRMQDLDAGDLVARGRFRGQARCRAQVGPAQGLAKPFVDIEWVVDAAFHIAAVIPVVQLVLGRDFELGCRLVEAKVWRHRREQAAQQSQELGFAADLRAAQHGVLQEGIPVGLGHAV